MIWKISPFICLCIFLLLGQYGAEHKHLWLIFLAVPFWIAAGVLSFMDRGR